MTPTIMPSVNILDQKACINENGGVYAGMDRFECRKKLWEDMRAQGLVIKEQPYTLNVPRSQRGGEIVEPMISTQWFVKIQPLADKALAAVRDGQTRIVPERFTKVYYNWLENIRDWCISRQLWWGHRIPVWYCDDCGKMTVTRDDPTECAHCHSKKIHQDEDVLDTWFSSGLWPFSTLGWPEKTRDLAYFYPTSVLETGADILFFWVARMMMFGIEFTGKPPFHTIYLHGLILDEKGQKMSKTKGNVIDPLTVMEELGTDALRFTLLVGSTPGKDSNLSLKKVEGNRNFANKIWNAGRFVIGSLGQLPEKPQAAPNWTLADSWIWARLNSLIRETERLFAGYQFGEAGRQIYEFFWGEFADWYLEIAKTQLAEGGDRAYYTAATLVRVLDASLRLLHPFTPFVTEELWQALKKASLSAGLTPFDSRLDWEEALIIAHWPEVHAAEGWEEQTVQDFSLIQEIVRSVRNLRAEKGVAPSKKIGAVIAAGEKAASLNLQKSILCSLANLQINNLIIVAHPESKPENAVSLVVSGVEIFLPLADLVDPEQEKARLAKEFAETTNQIERLDKLLSSDFGSKAPAQVVEKEQTRLAQFKETAEKLRQQLAAMNK